MRTNKIEAQDPRISFVVINANDDFMCSSEGTIDCSVKLTTRMDILI